MAQIDTLDTHYKDASPFDTVQRIRQLLHTKGILTYESVWHHNSRHYHSLSLQVSGTPVTVNGKGITPELALASAYGEMMERLQNLAPFRLMYDFSYETWHGSGFVYAPDEVSITLNDLIKRPGPWLRYQGDTLSSEAYPVETVRRWKKVSRLDDEQAPFHAVPFYHVSTGRLDYIPMEMLSKMYTSNGMAAGNTMEEALVQGLSEVFEQYANIRILHDSITPPDIPREWIMADPLLAGLVEDIESSGRYSLRFKDCSLGMGLPVVAALCTEIGTGRYFVKFGAQPIFQIAVERTLTELLQGQDLQNMKGFQSFQYTPSVSEDLQNMMGILINGSGRYPLSFFARTDDPPRSDHWREAASNQQLLHNMVDYILNNGWDLYVRDVSFLGFPACQIVIPGISEVEPFDSAASIEDYQRYVRICHEIRRLGSCNASEREALADEIAGLNMGHTLPLQWLRLEVNLPPWAYQNMDLLLIALYASADKADKAARHWQSFLENYTQFNPGANVPLYFRCAANYFSMLAGHQQPWQIQEALSQFYPQTMVTRVIHEFAPSTLQNEMPWLPCFHCDTCAWRSRCSHPALETLFLRLKKAYLENPIDQMALEGVFRSR